MQTFYDSSISGFYHILQLGQDRVRENYSNTAQHSKCRTEWGKKGSKKNQELMLHVNDVYESRDQGTCFIHYQSHKVFIRHPRVKLKKFGSFTLFIKAREIKTRNKHFIAVNTRGIYLITSAWLYAMTWFYCGLNVT